MQNANHQRIQERAYQIWLREGCPEGRDQDHWREAERDIAKESGATSAPPPVDSPPGATPAAAAGVDDASKTKRASRAKLKEDSGAETKGKPSKKQAGNGAVRELPRK